MHFKKVQIQNKILNAREPYKDIDKPEGQWKGQQPYRDDGMSNTIDRRSKLQKQYDVFS